METPSAPPTLAGRKQGSLGELTVVFGITVAMPLLFALTSRASIISYDFGQRRLLSTIVIELGVVALLWPWLAARGWSFRAIAGAPEPRDILRGVGVAILGWLGYYVSAITWVTFVPSTWDILRDAVPSGIASPWVVILVSIVNPIVEEFLWLGYGVTALSRFGGRAAAITSIALRLAVHAYQGMLAVIAVLPLGVAFTVYYLRTKRLWPVIVAHILFDILGLLAVVDR